MRDFLQDAAALAAIVIFTASVAWCGAIASALILAARAGQ